MPPERVVANGTSVSLTSTIVVALVDLTQERGGLAWMDELQCATNSSVKPLPPRIKPRFEAIPSRCRSEGEDNAEGQLT
jgi:hypothetical protein